MDEITARNQYRKAMFDNNAGLCLLIEKEFGLDGFPPSIVMQVLNRIADGEDLSDAIDEATGEL